MRRTDCRCVCLNLDFDPPTRDSPPPEPLCQVLQAHEPAVGGPRQQADLNNLSCRKVCVEEGGESVSPFIRQIGLVVYAKAHAVPSKKITTYVTTKAMDSIPARRARSRSRPHPAPAPRSPCSRPGGPRLRGARKKRMDSGGSVSIFDGRCVVFKSLTTSQHTRHVLKHINHTYTQARHARHAPILAHILVNSLRKTGEALISFLYLRANSWFVGVGWEV